MADNAYSALADALDRLPNGFPRTESNVEIRLLKKIISESDADIASLLSLTWEPPAAIAVHAGISVEKAAHRLSAEPEKGPARRRKTRDGTQTRHTTSAAPLGADPQRNGGPCFSFFPPGPLNVTLPKTCGRTSADRATARHPCLGANARVLTMRRNCSPFRVIQSVSNSYALDHITQLHRASPFGHTHLPRLS